MSHADWRAEPADPPMTFDQVRQLDEFAGRSACDFRVNYDTERWQVYGWGGVWMDTDIPAATEKPN